LPIDMLGKVLALLCAVFWACAVILFKRSGESMSPLSLNVFKTTVAGIVLMPIWYYFDPVLIPDTISMADLGLLAVSGIIGITLADSLFFSALNRLGAGPISIIDCVYSPSVIFLSWLILGEPFTIFHLVGAGLVVGGVLLATSDLGKLPDLSAKEILVGALSGMSAVLLMVFSILIVKPILDTHSAVMVVQCRMIPAILALHVIALIKKSRKQTYRTVFSTRALRLALPGAVLGNVLSMLAWVLAFKYTDLGSASILNQTNVIFVVILAAVFLKEPLDKRRVYATVLGFVGAAFVLCGS